MIAIQAFSVLVLAVILHEATHYVLLRRAGLSPRFAVRAWGLKGLGWAFSTAGADRRRLVRMWLLGPFVESAVWLSGAALFAGLRGVFLLVLVVSLAGNLLLPGSDGMRALRTRRRLALGGERPDPEKIRELELEVLDDPPDLEAFGRMCSCCPSAAVHLRHRDGDETSLWLCRFHSREFDGDWLIRHQVIQTEPGEWRVARDSETQFERRRRLSEPFTSFEAAMTEMARLDRAAGVIARPPWL